MYLHFIIDNAYSKKFIEVINGNFESDKHIFLIVTPHKLKYIDEKVHDNIIVVNYNQKSLFLSFGIYKQIKLLINKSSKIFVHYLEDIVIKILFHTNKPIYWGLWGADFYNYIDTNLYQSTTKKLLNEIEKKDARFRYNKILKFLKNQQKIYLYYKRKLFIEKISYILTWNTGDYELIKSNFKTQAERLDFFYPIPVSFSNLEDYVSNEKYNFKKNYEYVIQIGNSGDPSNNHLEIFKHIKKMNIEKSCVVSILSYGNQKYIEEVIENGKALFGANFIPITEYLSAQEYAYILKQIDISIMNHNRQQGVGNLISLAYLGKKIYINDFVTTFKFLKENQIDIFSIQSLYTFPQEVFNINNIQLSKNKKNIEDLFSEEKAINYLKDILDL